MTSVQPDGDMIIVLWDSAVTARDGKACENTCTWYLEMRDGKIANAIAFYDSVEFNDLGTRVKPAAESR